MADDATQADDTQQDAPLQEPGEDQQSDADRIKAEYEAKLAEKDAEIERTNAYVKRVQQQVPQDDAEPEPDTAPDDGSDEYSQYGLTKEQVTTLRKVTGADELQKKLDAYEKREQERQQQDQQSKMENDFQNVAKKYSDSGVPVPDSPAEKEKLLRFMQENNIFNMDVAFREMHGSRLETKTETPKAAKSDRSDSTEPSNDEAYQAAMAKVRKESPGNVEKIAEVEARFKGNPTV